MLRSVSLIDWTDRGVSDFKATVDRAEGAREAAKQLGGDYEVYWTMGQHDLVVVAEFPDDESATAFLLKLGSMGNVRSKSMRAFIAAEMRDIIGRAGRRSNAWTDAELNGGLLGLQPRFEVPKGRDWPNKVPSPSLPPPRLLRLGPPPNRWPPASPETAVRG